MLINLINQMQLIERTTDLLLLISWNKSKFNASFDTAPQAVQISNNQRGVKRRNKQKFSSWSFRNPQSLNKANFILRRPSSTIEAKNTG